MDQDSSSMEFHDVDDSPVKSVENLPKEKKKKKFGSLTLRRKSAEVPSEIKSATIPRKKRRGSITKLFNFVRKKSEDGIEKHKKLNFDDLAVKKNDDGLSCSQETICEVTSIGDTSPRLRQASLIGLEEDCKKSKPCMVEEDSSDSFKTADSPELRNDFKDLAVSYPNRGEPAIASTSQTTVQVFAKLKQPNVTKQKKKSVWKKFFGRDKIESVDGYKKVMSQNSGNVKKDRARGRGTTTSGKVSSPSTSSETIASPTVKPSVGTVESPPVKPLSSPKLDEETVRKSAEIGSQILQQKKEEGKRVTGDDLRKQLTEGLKNGSGKAKDVKNGGESSAVASEGDKKEVPDVKDEGTSAPKEVGSSPQDDPKGGDALPSTSGGGPDQFVPPTECKKEHLYKILVIGELGTGKTSIIKRYVHQFFSQHYRATIGVDFALKVLNWDENSIIRLQLWDIAGQERFGNMTRVYYKEAVGAFIVFDVTRAATFDAVQKWKQDLDSKVQLSDGTPIPCILLANKCDQPKEGIVNNKNKMDEYCKENGFAGWFEASAKENINIEDAAKSLVVKILQNDKLIKTGERGNDDRIALDGSSESGSKNCNC